jgi:hypothetical protein
MPWSNPLAIYKLRIDLTEYAIGVYFYDGLMEEWVHENEE